MSSSVAKIPRIVIAGTHSGVGKTTISVGIMAALKRRDMEVQPFKVGPDYLDPTYHKIVTGRDSRNLDGWMTSRSYVEECFTRAAGDCDLAVIEGVMGLFDGFSADSEQGSTAETAKWLNAPVVLVIDASAMARSVGAIALGYSKFDADLKLGGLIFNGVGGEFHLQLLTEAAAKTCDVKVIGGLQSDDALKLSERHLGLVTASQNIVTEEYLTHLENAIESQLDLDAIIALAQMAPDFPRRSSIGTCHSQRSEAPARPPICRIAVAQDEAFHFYYQDNIEMLQRNGADITPFSPIHDQNLPPEVHGIYLGGGYPEVYAERLEKNSEIRRQIKSFAERGGPIYAECGGFMYLTEGIETPEGKRFEMVGVFPTWVRMLNRLRALGYVEVEAVSPNIIADAGAVFRGHEYHCSEIIDEERLNAKSKLTYKLINRRGKDKTPRREGYSINNVLASYVHLHFGPNPKLPENFVRACELRA